MSAIPAWLQRHLESRGLWDADGITRAVRTRRCPTCHRRILTGLDSKTAGGPATVDARPLSVLGETIARTVGRTTYALWWAGDRLELEIRFRCDLRGWPADGQRRYDVVADHACTHRPLPAVPSVHARPAVADTTGPPPF